jgi:hypothetical protein
MLSSDDETTQQRKSVFELMNQLGDIFDSIAPPTPNPDGSQGPKTAPMHLLPSLIESFEARKGLEILAAGEKDQLRAFSMANPDQTVSVEDLVMVLQAMGATSTPSKPRQMHDSSPSLLLETEPEVPASPELVRTRTNSPVRRHPAARNSIKTSISTPNPTTPTELKFGSRIPVRPRTTSAMSNYSSSSLLTPTRGQPSPTPASPRRTSLQSALSFSPGGKVGGFTDLSEIVVANGGTYLGVPLDGPLGPGFEPREEADKLRAATDGMGVGRLAPMRPTAQEPVCELKPLLTSCVSLIRRVLRK